MHKCEFYLKKQENKNKKIFKVFDTRVLALTFQREVIKRTTISYKMCLDECVCGCEQRKTCL